MGFKEEYAKFTQPSQAREEFVYKAVTSLPKSQILNSMKPITVDMPDQSKRIYKVMPDYFSIQGMRVPMSGQTAQRVADYFGLSLPNTAIAKAIHQKADVQVSAKPLSGSGATVDGKHYSGQDVVDTGVGYGAFAPIYSDNVDKQLAQKGAKPGDIVSGFAKDIIAPPAKGLGLYGMWDKNGNPIQGGNGQTPHDTSIHTEYGSFFRGVSPEFTEIAPDGTAKVKSLNTTRYTPASNKPVSPSKPSDLPKLDSPAANKPLEPAKPTPITTESLLKKVDDFLSQIGIKTNFASNQEYFIRKNKRIKILKSL